METKETMIDHGQFWLQGNEQRRLWGTLSINEFNDSRLETFGSLIDPTEGSSRTIVGLISSGQQYVTLIDCIPTKTQNWGSGEGQTDWSHQTYLVNKVVKGLSFEKGEDIAFRQAILEISTLSKWSNPNLVKVNFSKASTKPSRVSIAIRARQDEATTVRFLDDVVKISVRFQPKELWEQHGVITSYRVQDSCQLIIERADGNLLPLDSILSVAGVMLDILSICCNETPRLDNFYVLREELKRRPAEVYVRWREYGAEEKEGSPFAVLSLTDLGGMEVVSRWFEVTERYGAALKLLMTNWYNDNAYPEDKLSRMYTAVEGLLSRKKGRDRSRMTSLELANFVEEAIPSFSNLTNRPAEDWAQSVKEIRDQRISHSDPTSTLVIKGLTIHVMTNLLYVAGASFLLREMDMSESQIKRYLEGSYQTLLLSERR